MITMPEPQKTNSQPDKPLSLEAKRLEAKRERALAKVERFSRKLPNLSPGAEALRVNMLRSARAELTLIQKAIGYEATNPRPTENDLALWRLLNIPVPDRYR
jgi:hypothetical protein